MLADARSTNVEEWIRGKQADGQMPPGFGSEGSGTSIFDPVLTELAYRWFCPPGGVIVDPFAGGSVRGVVASVLGYRYHGVELRPEQVAANRAQWATIGDPTAAVVDPDALTPVQRAGDVWLKRDDLFVVNGVPGGKARTCLALARGAAGLVTAGSRSSPQVNIVSAVAQAAGIPARCHTPAGPLSPEVQAAAARGAEIVQHSPGYNTVIVARARDDAAARGWREIPFGMECGEAVTQTRRQVANLPASVRRIVIPCGSGMTAAGVLHGLDDIGRGDVAVVAVTVGADPTDRLDRYAPTDWRSRLTLVPSGTDYHAPAADTTFAGVNLDAHYEAKCVPLLRAGDLLWVVGIRATAVATAAPKRTAPVWTQGDSRNIRALVTTPADMVFSCPPYADLEVYSDDPADLSTLDYPAFVDAYRHIIAETCALLKPDSFAAFVVGEVRDKRGNYRNFVGDTVAAFQAAGLHYYNEAILVTAAGSLPVRAGRQFLGGRKLGKTHQQMLVFVKGDGNRAARRCNP